MPSAASHAFIPDDGELRRRDSHPTDLDRAGATTPAQGHRRAPIWLSRSCAVRDGPRQGLREHELIALSVGDVFRDGRPRRRLLLSVFKGAGKAGGTQEVLLSESLRGKLRRFHQWKARERECLDDEAPLFVSRLGRRLSLRQVRHGFTVWQDRAGFERRVTFHMLRHSAVTNLYALTKDIRLTQRFARHRSLVTTMVYTHPSEDDLVKAVEGLRC